MPLTYFLPTDMEKVYEFCKGSPELNVGDILGTDDDDLKLKVVAYYPYYPLALNAERVALAIVHPTDEPLYIKEAWYCWQVAYYYPQPALHILKHGDEVIRVEEVSESDTPEIGKKIFQYCTDGLVPEPPKLDRESLKKFMATAHERPVGLEIYSFSQHRNLDSPFREICLVNLQPSKVISAA